MELEERLQNLKKLRKDYQKQLKADGAAAIKAALAEFWSKHADEVHSLEWNQYTPYFMDGDTCTFGFNGISFKLNSSLPCETENKPIKDEDEDVYEDSGENNSYHEAYEAGELVRKKVISEALGKSIKSLNQALDQLDDCLELVYGDHVKVTVTSDGKATTEEYSDHN